MTNPVNCENNVIKSLLQLQYEMICNLPPPRGRLTSTERSTSTGRSTSYFRIGQMELDAIKYANIKK